MASMSPVRVIVRMIVVVMIVTAIGAVHMRRGAMIVMAMIVMAVIMIMIVSVAVIVTPVRRMIVIVIVNGRGRDISAAFRIERRFDLDHCGAETPRHVFDHMVAANAQTFLQKLGRQVAIAQVPGDAHQRGGVGASNFRQILRCCDHFDDPSVLQRQAVASAQHHRFRQVEKEGEAAHAGHRNASAIAVFVIENDRVGGFAGPGAGGTDGMSVLHDLAEI
jgi:hypothetical protein